MSVLRRITLQCDRCGREEDFEYQYQVVNYRAENLWTQTVDDDGCQIDLCLPCSKKRKAL